MAMCNKTEVNYMIVPNELNYMVDSAKSLGLR